ncbi:MAG: hypothetical protein V4675_21565 [Verrucomicrobiota bacterium]
MKTIAAFPLITACLLTPLPLVQADVTITPSQGFILLWDGNEGDNFSAENPAPVPPNLATGAGATAIASGELAVGPHYIPTLNDGLYGNANSWIGADGNSPAFAGIALGQLTTITSFAFGRDNGNNVTDPQDNGYLGQLPDRCLGLYTIQITRIATPDATTQETGDAATGWVTVGTLDYIASEDAVIGGGFTAYYRHEYEIAEGVAGVQATGFRILVPGTGISPAGTAIDEIELYGPAVVNPDIDGDGFDDTFETALGFNPNNPLSTPESKTDIFTSIEFSFHTAKNRTYRIESSANLQDWETVESGIIGRGGEMTRLYSTRAPKRLYYRSVRVTPP